MKFFQILLLINLLVGCSPLCAYDKSILLVVIMVKNEVDVIISTLKPFVDEGVHSFLVFDTGSTDGTQDKVRNYFKECGLTDTHVIEEPFIDFSASRNRALDLAEQLFPDHAFMIMLDAEWYAHNVHELLVFCEHNKKHTRVDCSGSCYLVRLYTVQDAINNFVVRLMRPGYNVRYTGPVHETIKQLPSGMVPEEFYFEYNPASLGRQASKNRCARDYALLKKAYQDNPDDLRSIFYLGQTCQFLDEWDQAIFYYQKRLDLGELSEEKYLAAYRIACAIEYMVEGVQENTQGYTWDDALRYYLKAHGMIPYRAEPLFRIACYYIRHNQHALAYLFAIRAAQLPYPSNNSLFVEKKIYDYSRYAILGQCALYAGEIGIGKEAILHAMSVDSKDQSLYHNLAIYNQFLEQVTSVPAH